MAELKIGIGADNSGLTKALKDAEAQISSFTTKMGRLGDQLSSVGQKLSIGLTIPLTALGAGALKAYGDIQALQKGLEAVMGSANAAGSEFNKLKEVAKLPGLGMEEAVKGSINLQAIGMDAEKSRNILSQFGNAVATVGKGRAEFERAIYGVQQLANTDFPLGEDLNIIKDALPQVSNLLKEAFGSSRSDELAKMGVSSQQVLAVITEGLEKLPRVTGGINGAFENLGDSLKTTLGRIGKVIDDAFDISGIIDKLTDYLDRAVTAFESLSPTIQKAIIVVGGLTAVTGPLLLALGGFLTMLPVLVTGLGALKVAFVALIGPIGLVVVGIGVIIAAVVSNWSKITPYLVRTANNFIQLYNESQEFRSGILSVGFAFEGLYAIIKSFSISAYNTLKSFGKGVLSLFEGVSLMIRGAFNADPEMISEGWAKANAKVALSFDDLGARITGVENKYNKLLKNDKLKFVTEADLNIDTEKVATKTKDAIVNGMRKGATEAAKSGVEKELEPIDTQKLKDSLDRSYAEVSSYQKMLRDLYYNTAASITNSIPAITTAMTDVQASVTDNIISLRDEFAKMADFGNFLGNAIGTSFSFVRDTIADSFASIGEAMTAGGNVMSSVGETILGGISSFLSSLGKQMIQYGVAALAMAVLSKMLTNPITAAPAAIAMIAAGAALSMIGGAIKGTLTGGGTSGGTVPSGGGVSSQSYSSSFSHGGVGGSGEVVFRISGNDLVGVLSRQQDKNARLGG